MLQSQRLRLVEVTDVPHNMLLLDFLFSHKEGKKRRREKKAKQWNKTNNKTRIWLMKKNKIRKKKKKVLTFAKIPQRMSQANKIWNQPTQDDRYLGQPVFPSTLRGGKKKNTKHTHLEVKNDVNLTFLNFWASKNLCHEPKLCYHHY